MNDLGKLLERLSDGRVDFILVGGVAATVHGSSRLTEDIDVVYQRSPENIQRLARALADVTPYLRGAPRGLPFQWDAITIERGLNFTLTTTLGAIDLFGEIVGGGRYEALLPHSIEVDVFGTRCKCLGLRQLIDVKRATGRPKDFEAIAELEAILEENARNEGD